MGASSTVARRYARALLDVSSASAGAEGPAPVRAALEGARSLLESHPELMRALTNPAFPMEARKKVASAVFAPSPEIVRRLLHLLMERERVPLLPAIAAIYAELWNAARGVVSAEALSAVKLDAGEEQALREALERATGRSVELATRVDPGLIGGLRVTLLGRTFDGTVKAQLQALRRSLRGAA